MDGIAQGQWTRIDGDRLFCRFAQPGEASLLVAFDAEDFPVRLLDVESMGDRAPKHWTEGGGFTFALPSGRRPSLRFEAHGVAVAVKIGVRIGNDESCNSLTGEPWAVPLMRDPTDYLVLRVDDPFTLTLREVPSDSPEGPVERMVVQLLAVPLAAAAQQSGRPRTRSGFEDDDYCAQQRRRYPAGQWMICHDVNVIHRNEMKHQRAPFEINRKRYEQKWGVKW